MQISFRQGIIQQELDGNNVPEFIRENSSNNYDLIVFPTPTIITFAHGISDYAFVEPNTVQDAWVAPVNGWQLNTYYWFYWDIDLITGVRTFGYTTVPPTVQVTAPAHPVANLHWFDLSTTTMKVFNGANWVEKVRLFAAQLAIKGGEHILTQNKIGSQVGINNVHLSAGFILFDDNQKPVKRYENNRSAGKFITTETPLATQLSKASAITLEASWFEAKATIDIPAYYAICFTGANQIGLASYTNPSQPAVGVSTNPIPENEIRTFIRSGYVTNPVWNWTVLPGTRLFVGNTGEITTTVPNKGSVQQIAEVVSSDTIFVNIEPIIILA